MFEWKLVESLAVKMLIYLLEIQKKNKETNNLLLSVLLRIQNSTDFVQFIIHSDELNWQWRISIWALQIRHNNSSSEKNVNDRILN